MYKIFFWKIWEFILTNKSIKLQWYLKQCQKKKKKNHNHTPGIYWNFFPEGKTAVYPKTCYCSIDKNHSITMFRSFETNKDYRGNSIYGVRPLIRLLEKQKQKDKNKMLGKCIPFPNWSSFHLNFTFDLPSWYPAWYPAFNKTARWWKYKNIPFTWKIKMIRILILQDKITRG